MDLGSSISQNIKKSFELGSSLLNFFSFGAIKFHFLKNNKFSWVRFFFQNCKAFQGFRFLKYNNSFLGVDFFYFFEFEKFFSVSVSWNIRTFFGISISWNIRIAFSVRLFLNFFRLEFKILWFHFPKYKKNFFLKKHKKLFQSAFF